MFKESVLERLDEKRDASVKELEKHDAVKEVKLLMEKSSADDMRIMEGLGSNHQFMAAHNAWGAQLEFNKKEEQYAGKVYTKNQIRDMAIAYNLRFLKSQHYTGVLDVQVTAKIKEFATAAGVELTRHTLSEKFFILAPVSQFKREKEVILKPRKEVDPVMFYKIDEDHYRFIHKWGKDFTTLRLLSGARNANASSYTFFKAFEIMPIVAVLLTVLFSATFVAAHLITFALMVIGVSLLTAFIIYYNVYTDGNGATKKGAFSNTAWDSSKTYVYED